MSDLVRTAFLPLSGITYSEGEKALRVHVVRKGEVMRIVFTIADTEKNAKALAAEYGGVMVTEELFDFMSIQEANQTGTWLSGDHVRSN